MAKPKVYVTNGLGIGCHEETAHAYLLAGADPEIVHIKQLLTGEKNVSDAQIIDFAGGFLQGDILGAGMCAANELEHALVQVSGKMARLKDRLIRFSDKGVIYGQCNGFQLLVKTGLLPGINSDYSKQTVTLTHNDCGSYRVDYVTHKVDPVNRRHFAFDGLADKPLDIWCRHGEGKLMFNSDSGLVPREEGEKVRKIVNARHVFLRYIEPHTMCATEQYPYNPNGSVNGIAGLVNANGHIFGHMAHTEVGVYKSRSPDWFFMKEMLRRKGRLSAALKEDDNKGDCFRVFENIVAYFK